MLLDGRVELELFFSVFHVNLLDHGVEQRLLRLGRGFLQQIVELCQRLPDLRKGNGLRHAVLQFALDLVPPGQQPLMTVFQLAE
ncbi:hypothetical protein BSK65_29025 [Paenibacillus odorifer]|uniref:Uncharacterized protein n=1 Tax=Paenibacillus odorifer TaxID=189426 RepID=A0A1R0Z7Y6_9BACL|nr:hypothetical protein BSK65_29025 [Paenibacillus odorifer]